MWFFLNKSYPRPNFLKYCFNYNIVTLLYYLCFLYVYIPLLRWQALGWPDLLSQKSIKVNYVTCPWLGLQATLSYLYLKHNCRNKHIIRWIYRDKAIIGECRQHQIHSYKGGNHSAWAVEGAAKLQRVGILNRIQESWHKASVYRARRKCNQSRGWKRLDCKSHPRPQTSKAPNPAGTYYL